MLKPDTSTTCWDAVVVVVPGEVPELLELLEPLEPPPHPPVSKAAHNEQASRARLRVMSGILVLIFSIAFRCMAAAVAVARAKAKAKAS
ncbi:hypothetical protein [Paraburkholderia phosphatilytica]|uniref:hypothetical protein n=1 Tax=Paraburkholderia phosphatilytica TaxID=2282883 RepID=UPI0013DE9BF0|nr:hypothetical protein [Paraburkholderia phosphatilytica]